MLAPSGTLVVFPLTVICMIRWWRDSSRLGETLVQPAFLGNQLKSVNSSGPRSSSIDRRDSRSIATGAAAEKRLPGFLTNQRGLYRRAGCLAALSAPGAENPPNRVWLPNSGRIQVKLLCLLAKFPVWEEHQAP